MLLSLNWLKDFVEIPKSVTPQKLGELLTLHTVEVEKIASQAGRFKNVTVGKILEVKPHPNADKLRLASVDVGSQKLEIVCGAPNIAPGQFVPVALIGAILPNGAEIKPAEIRGVKSNGMLCAEDELGLGDDHNGIMILAKASIGQSLADYLNLTDTVLEVDNKSITHRADLWSHYGLARDISAILDTKFKEMKTPLIPLYKGDKKALLAKEGQGRFSLSVKVEDFKLCPRYMAAAVGGVKVEPSPDWLRQRLIAAGMRPINNIVDVTNYVMLELGQPLHAFDKKMLDGIIVRRAKAGEIMETLDGEKRQLEAGMLVIADKTKPVAVAGVMGGANSEINDKTETIVIESANFDYDSVRKTAAKLGLRTESSMRFEKGLDPNLAELGLKRAVELILKLCPGAEPVGGLIDEKTPPLIPLLKGDKRGLGPIEFDLNWLNNFLGHNFSVKEVRRILEKLGFSVKEKNERFSVVVPSWRAVRDIKIAEDIAEEVIRIYGYNKIVAQLPAVKIEPPPVNEEKVLERNIKNLLSLGAGFTEVYNYSFLSAAAVESGEKIIKLANPLSADLAVLRPSLIPGLLANVKTNQANEEKISLYEIGSIFLNQPGENELLFQEKRLAMIMAEADGDDLARKIKGAIEYLFAALNLTAEFGAAGEIMAGDKAVGRLESVETRRLNLFGVKKSVMAAEISLPALLKTIKNAPARAYKEPPRYPPVIRDLAFVINEKILYNNIVAEIKNFSDLIGSAELFDVYQGPSAKLGAGNKSLAFHIIYQADRTLTSNEVDDLQGKLIKHLEKKFSAKIRDF